MAEARTSKPFKSTSNFWTRWMPQVIVGLYLLAAMLAYIFIPMLATGWLIRPFLGAFVEQTMIFNGVDSSIRPSTWSGYNQGLTSGYRLIEFDGKPIQNSLELGQALTGHQIGDRAELTVASPDHQTKRVPVSLMRLPWQDQLTFLVFPYAIGLIYL
jgi:S1-C subfamily serine protease